MNARERTASGSERLRSRAYAAGRIAQRRDPGLALRIYRQSMRRGEDEKAALRALVEGVVLADDAEVRQHASAAR